MALRTIIGHDKPIRILLGGIKRDRVPSSILFSGDSGVGKMLTALNYAKALNCLAPQDHDACDKCPSCLKTDNASHPDVTTICPENAEIKIEAVRQAEETLWLKPYEGRKKILMVDDAEMMNISAANAFLKTLEEPPQGSVIILISSDPDRLPATIRSRCMHVRFRPLAADAYKQALAKIFADNKPGAVSGLFMGRPGTAVADNLDEAEKWFMDILNSMLRGESKCAWADKADIKRWLDLCVVWLRDMAVFGTTGRETDLFLSDRRPSQAPTPLLNAGEKLQRIRSDADMNLSKAITWNVVSGIIQEIAAQPGRRLKV
jgi:DNA polymerase III subunit delta'